MHEEMNEGINGVFNGCKMISNFLIDGSVEGKKLRRKLERE